MTEGEMGGWHRQPNGHEFGSTLRDGDGQGSLACCCPWDFPGKSAGVGCHCLLYPTEKINVSDLKAINNNNR